MSKYFDKILKKVIQSDKLNNFQNEYIEDLISDFQAQNENELKKIKEITNGNYFKLNFYIFMAKTIMVKDLKSK